MRWTHITKQLLWKLLSTFYRKTFPFSPQASRRHLISLHRLVRDTVSKLGNVVEAFTLWNECTPQRAVSWNVSFWVLFQDISLFAIVFNVLQNIALSVLQEQGSNTALLEGRCNSLSGMHTSQSVLSESFTPGFIRRYFLFPHSLNVSLNITSRIRLWWVSIHLGRSINTLTSAMHTSQRGSSEIFSPISIWRYFHFHRKPQGAPVYPIAGSPKRVLEYCSMKTET